MLYIQACCFIIHAPDGPELGSCLVDYRLRHLQWDLANEHRFLNRSTISKFDRAGFLIFGLVLVSRDSEVGTNISCEESTVSLHTGLIFQFSLRVISQ